MFSTTVLASSFLSAILHSMVRFQAAKAESFTSHKLCTLLRRLPFKFETVMQIMMPCTLWTVLWISIPFTSGIFLVFIASSLVWILPFDCKAFSFWFGVGVFFPFMTPGASWDITKHWVWSSTGLFLYKYDNVFKLNLYVLIFWYLVSGVSSLLSQIIR